MKSKLLLLALLLTGITAAAQFSFIGQTKKEVKAFWSTRVSSQYFAEGKLDGGSHDDYFVIQQEGTAGIPTFSAIFDKKGICKENASNFTEEYYSRYIAVMNGNKNLKKQGDRWLHKSEPYYFEIKPMSDGTFLIVCKKRNA